MKHSSCLIAGLLALALAPVLAQPVAPGPERPLTTKDLALFLASSTNSLPRFDLDFPGGTPKELAKAVEKVTGKPLNAVIPDDCAGLKIFPISVKNVTVAQLFEVLTQASKRTERYTVIDPRELSIGGHGSDVYVNDSHYGFSTVGLPTENSIWYFYRDKGSQFAPWQVLSSTVCKFYQLGPYLEAGYTVEDITTAVKTGWKMLGVIKPPEITYHKDTKVLIAVGEEDKVKLIGDVLKQLSQGKPKEKSANSQTEKIKTE